jgi:hypothetical protein
MFPFRGYRTGNDAHEGGLATSVLRYEGYFIPLVDPKIYFI